MSKITQKLIQTQKLSPQQILNASIIQLNSNLIEKKILDELEHNPALELVDNVNKDDSADEEDENKFEWDELISNPEEYDYKGNTSSKKDFSIAQSRLVEKVSLVDDIKNQLNDLNATDEELAIAEYIIGNLNDDGYLEIDSVLLADKFTASEKEVEVLIDKIKLLDPPGIASKNLQDCLISQLKYSYNQETLALEVIKNHFERFKAHKYSDIIKKISCTKEEFDNVLSIISLLNPRPAINYSDASNYHLIPDIVLDKHDNKWVVTSNDQHLPRLSLSNTYRKMIQNSDMDKDAKKYIKQKIQKANWFIDAINNRFNTIIKIMESIIKYQPTYFNADNRFLKPLKLQTIAEDINMDISTISRSTNDKYVQLPWGIRELKSFFSDGVKTKSGEYVSNTIVKKLLAKIIHSEDPSKPFNDQEITNLINNEGYIIARRTITKYRELLKIPVSRLRKKNI